jgi:methanogenic corrinoid protein MtbC1
MNIELSTQIKSLRKLNGYTQKEFADLLGVGQATVSNYEKGIRVPDTEKLAKIASIFEVTLDYLLGRDMVSLSKKEVNTKIMAFKSLNEACRTFLHLLIEGNRKEAVRLIYNLRESKVNIRDIYFEILGKALKEVGVLWERGNIDVWKEHYISEIVMDIMRELKVRERKSKNKSRSVLALTPCPEMHNIGLKMIADLLELEGWDVTYIGSNVPVLSIIKAIEITKPNVIAFSVTMPYHIEAAKNIIAALRSYFDSEVPRIIVGGLAFLNCKDPCEETGADFYGLSLEDVESAIEKRGI